MTNNTIHLIDGIRTQHLQYMDGIALGKIAVNIYTALTLFEVKRDKVVERDKPLIFNLMIRSADLRKFLKSNPIIIHGEDYSEHTAIDVTERNLYIPYRYDLDSYETMHQKIIKLYTKISMIKYYRDRYALNLSDSKNLVEEDMAESTLIKFSDRYSEIDAYREGAVIDTEPEKIITFTDEEIGKIFTV